MKTLCEEVLDAAAKLTSQGRDITIGNLTMIVFPGTGNEQWLPASDRIRQSVKHLTKKNRFPFILSTRSRKDF